MAEVIWEGLSFEDISWVISEAPLSNADRESPQFMSGFHLAMNDKLQSRGRNLSGYPSDFVRGYKVVKRTSWWDKTNARLTQLAADLGSSRLK